MFQIFSRFLERVDEDDQDEEKHWYHIQEKLFLFQITLQNFKEFTSVNSMSQQKQPSGYLVQFTNRDKRNRPITLTSYYGSDEHVKSEFFIFPIAPQQTLEIKYIDVDQITLSYHNEQQIDSIDEVILYQWRGRKTQDFLFSRKGTKVEEKVVIYI